MSADIYEVSPPAAWFTRCEHFYPTTKSYCQNETLGVYVSV